MIEFNDFLTTCICPATGLARLFLRAGANHPLSQVKQARHELPPHGDRTPWWAPASAAVISARPTAGSLFAAKQNVSRTDQAVSQPIGACPLYLWTIPTLALAPTPMPDYLSPTV